MSADVLVIRCVPVVLMPPEHSMGRPSAALILIFLAGSTFYHCFLTTLSAMIEIDAPVSGVASNLNFLSGRFFGQIDICLLYTSPSPRDKRQSRMPSSA